MRAAGAIPDVRPLIDLVPCEAEEECRAIDIALKKLDRYDDLLFASSNAVRFFFYHLDRLGLRSLLADLRARVLCIGSRTAQAALREGLSAHFVLTGGRGDAESMLEEIRSTLAPSGRQILIPQSNRGRSVLPEGLLAAGAEVEALPFYRNVEMEVDEVALRADLIAGRIDGVTFTSPSAVQRFISLLDPSAHRAASRCMIAAIGHTTAEALAAAKLPVDVVPDRPDVRALASALNRYVAQERSRPARKEDQG